MAKSKKKTKPKKARPVKTKKPIRKIAAKTKKRIAKKAPFKAKARAKIKPRPKTKIRPRPKPPARAKAQPPIKRRAGLPGQLYDAAMRVLNERQAEQIVSVDLEGRSSIADYLIIASGRADLCAIARPHLSNPAWTLEAAAKLGFQAQWWPQQYLSGKSQLERNLQRAAQVGGGV